MSSTPSSSSADSEKVRPRRAVWLRRAGWLVGTVLVLMALAWLALPHLLRWQGEERLTKLLGRPVTIGKVEFLPWSLELTVRDFAIAGLAGEPPLLKIARSYVNVQTASMWRLAPVIESAQLDAPVVHVARLAEGRYDIDDLIARFTPASTPPPAGEPARFSLNNLQLRDGALSFDDKPVGRRHELRQLNLSLPFISNLPSDIELTVKPRLAFELNGAAFDSGAQATPFAKDRETALQIHVGDAAKGDLDLTPYLPYVPKSLPVRIVRGHVGADLDVAFELAADGTPTLGVKGSVRAGDLAVTDAAGTPLLGLTKLVVPVVSLQPLRREVHFGAVQLDGADLKVARDDAGRISLLQLAGGGAAPAPAPATKAGSSATPAPPASVASSPSAASGAGAGQGAPAAPAPWKLQVDSLALQGATVDWNDAAVRPAAALRLESLSMTAKSLRWPAPTAVPLSFAASLRSQAGGEVAGRLGAEGSADDKAAKLDISVGELALPALAPYLAQFIVPRVDGRLDLKASVDWAAGDPAQLKLGIAEATLAGLSVTPPPEAGAGKAKNDGALSLQQLRLADVMVDLPGQRVTVGSLALKAPDVKLARDAQGRWNLQQWAVKAPAAAEPVQATATPSPAPAAASGWLVELAAFDLDGGRVGFVDQRPRPGAKAAETVRFDLGALAVSAKGLAWDDRAGGKRSVPPARLQVSANLVRPADAAERNKSATARIEWRGEAGLQPLSARGTARIERFPVQAFQPYVENPLRLTLQRALAGYRGDVTLSDDGRGLAVKAAGEVLISDLSVLSRPESEQAEPDELLSWQSLALRGLKVALQPGGRPNVEIAQAELSDFYSRLIITEEGRFNLQDVAPPRGPPAPGAAAGSAPASAPASDAVAAAPAAPASAASAASGVAAAAGEKLPLELYVGGVALRNGRIDFTDHFVRPNYSAALTELNGSLGAFRSGSREMATLELRGRAEGTALLEITGQLNPTVDPLALDIRAKATDLELAPLSPYAAKYAGYDIERGKLTMDVSYRIQPDGRLDAKNQVILNQLTFGNKVESPSATKLPVLLAVALLKDRHGVIDIDLPVSGSINDPQFSVFGLIFKVIGNLLVKALTSPFSLLSGGGPDDLSTIEFRPGTATLAAGDAAAIDKVAKALNDRPALTMTVTGSSDLSSERDAYRRAALEQRLLAERKREQLSDGAPADAPVTMSAEDRSRLLESMYSRTKLEDKPRNVLGIAKDIPPAEMERMLSAAIPVTGDTMRELALQRGLAVRDALIAKGLPSERLFIAAPRVRAADDKAPADFKPGVQLTLSAK